MPTAPFAALNRMIDDNVTGPVSSRRLFGASVITVAGKDMFAIVQPDVDEGANEDLTQVTAAVVSRLSVALQEAAEARTPERLLRAGLRSLFATLLLAGALLVLVRLHRLIAQRASRVAEAGLAKTGLPTDDVEVRGSWVLVVVRRVARFIAIAIGAVVVYTWLTYVLQQFPVTRPWGEALGGFLIATVKRLGWSAITAMPGLFTAAIIFLCTRFVVRLTVLVFDAVEQGRLHLAGINGPRALPTRRIVTTLLWLFAIVIAYPYLPGSNTEAFKGVSVFIGLVVSIGSSGIVNQLMSGFMLTYSDAIAPGEYVRLGDIEGTVTNLGVLSTKIRTRRNEEVTIPNAVVISGTATNFTRNAAEGVFAPVVVTIGYDAPWRQVEALLLLAASRSEGLRQTPATARAPDRTLGLLRGVHAAGVRGRAGAAHPDHVGRARADPGCLQRARRADHVAALRGGPRGRQAGAAGEVVRGPGAPQERRLVTHPGRSSERGSRIGDVTPPVGNRSMEAPGCLLRWWL